METLAMNGQFTPPKLESLEYVLRHGIDMVRGRVFADLWDIEQFADCDKCVAERKERLNRINLTQQLLPPVECDCESSQ